ncbi:MULTISPECIES: hypothetical protein [Brevundimonas]|uniref:hypothetical protein n=1 Tax=Brevundimonas TaxID=41275 RepID=UPI0025BC5779|nr:MULTISPECIES: hypothetical protein [Brevundimonas]
MRIVTFMSANDGAIARIEMPMPSKGGLKLGWSPVVIHAATEDEARAKAQAFYDGELQRLANKSANMAEGRAKAAATRAANQGAA